MTVTLRRYADGDLALTLELETDPVTMAELGGPRPREALERVHVRRTREPLALVVEDDGDPVGFIGVWEGEHEGAPVHETGWMVLPRAQGRGVASAALALLLDRVRTEPGITELHAFPGATNPASLRVCDSAGFEDRGETVADFGGAELTCRHRVLGLRTGARGG